MPARMTQEEMIARAQAVHPGKYDYSGSIYRGIFEKMLICCPTHGPFEKSPHHHLRGQGCPDCAMERKKAALASTTDEFVAKAKTKHAGEPYSYNRVVYVNNHTKVEISCEKHGPFEMTPAHHLSGQRCPECARERTNLGGGVAGRRLNDESFRAAAREVHGDAYDYSGSAYRDYRTKVAIRCKAHDFVFRQAPANHITGNGCPKCKFDRIGAARRGDKAEFVAKAEKVHGKDVYDYDGVDYKNSQTKVTIRCKRHGHLFEMTPAKHLLGQGCRECGRDRQAGRWSPDSFTPEYGAQPCCLYYMRFDRAGERSFWKIGTTSDHKKRLNVLRVRGYAMTTLRVWRGTRLACSRVERLVLAAYRRSDRYDPGDMDGAGGSECFRRDVLGLDAGQVVPPRRRGMVPPPPGQLAPAAFKAADESEARREAYHAAGVVLEFDRATIGTLLDRALAADAHRWLGFQREEPPLLAHGLSVEVVYTGE